MKRGEIEERTFFSLLKPLEFVWGLPKWKLLLGKKTHFSCWKKQKELPDPLEKYSYCRDAVQVQTVIDLVDFF